MERRMRIGELARSAGVSPDVLRAWERRYGLLRPARSEGGYRLYSAEDDARVRAMVRHVEAGVPASEAARLVLEGAAPDEPSGPPLPGFSGELRAALDRFDDTGAQAALDRSIGALSFDAVAREVILPYLRELGDRWERGEASVAQEHFASNVIRGRLLALARGWDRGGGPRAVLACAPGEQHDLGLIVFGLALRHQGWSVTYLGADTPVETLAAAAEQLQPDAVVVVALEPGKLEPIRAPLEQLARGSRLLLAGAGTGESYAADVGAELLRGDPVDAAAQLAPASGRRSAAGPL
jgi:MerR family transcriptional regulator, light-induced transcriptional regulator